MKVLFVAHAGADGIGARSAGETAIPGALRASGARWSGAAKSYVERYRSPVA